jgi:hypothetical protein
MDLFKFSLEINPRLYLKLRKNSFVKEFKSGKTRESLYIDSYRTNIWYKTGYETTLAALQLWDRVTLWKEGLHIKQFKRYGHYFLGKTV